MIVTTSNDISGHAVTQYLGVVRGLVVRSPTIMQGISGGLKQFIGGNIGSYAEACEVARKEAYDRLIEHAEGLGADAVIAMRYDAAEFTSGVTEVLAYGTAVKIMKA